MLTTSARILRTYQPQPAAAFLWRRCSSTSQNPELNSDEAIPATPLAGEHEAPLQDDAIAASPATALWLPTLNSSLAIALAAMNISGPNTVQQAACASIYQRNSVMLRAETGSGKTLAYLVPLLQQALDRNFPAFFGLILVPSRELAIQVYNVASQLLEVSFPLFARRDTREPPAHGSVAFAGGANRHPHQLHWQGTAGREEAGRRTASG